MVFQQNLLEKAYFMAKMSGSDMVRPASSDFCKVPLESCTKIYNSYISSVCLYKIINSIWLKVLKKTT